MKKIKKILALSFTFILFLSSVSCQSPKTEQISSDIYEDTYESEDEETAVSDDTETKTFNSTKKNNKSLKDIFSFGNKNDYIEIEDSFTVFVKEFTSLKEKPASFRINTKDGKAGFSTNYLNIYFILQFDAKDRDKLRKAADAYFYDFENKKLDRRGKGTDKKYGGIDYRLNWGSRVASTPNYGNANGLLGYEFINGSPYFMISNKAILNKYYEVAGESTSRESVPVKIYFTRSQLKQLLELLTEENINDYLYGFEEEFSPHEADEY